MAKANECLLDSTLVHVDADAQNQTYVKESGEKSTSLNLIHRTLDCPNGTRGAEHIC